VHLHSHIGFTPEGQPLVYQQLRPIHLLLAMMTCLLVAALLQALLS
jgi:hypothetical protein